MGFFDDDEDQIEGMGSALRDRSREYGGLGAALLQYPAAAAPSATAPGILGKLSTLADKLQQFDAAHQRTLAQCALPADSPGLRPASPQTTRQSFDDDFGALMKSGNVDIQVNGDEARKLNPIQFYNKIRSGGDWDYKKDTDKQTGINPKFPGQSADQIQKFGNANFGYVGAAYGLPLWMLAQGAGLYQTFNQDETPKGPGPWRGLSQGAFATMDSGDHLPGVWDLPDDQIRALAAQGCQFGDNPDDTNEIIKGYDHYHAQHPSPQD
jgi:hypothetical protein